MELQIIVWVGFSQALFAAILMLTKSERSIPDKILTAWLLLLAAEFLTTGIDYSVYNVPLLSSAFLLFNPAFYLYIKSLTNRRFVVGWKHLLHLIPFITFEVFAYILKEPFTLKEFFDTDKTLWFRYAFTISTFISLIGYNITSILMVHRHRMSLKDEFSTIERYKKLGWLRFVVVAYNIFCAAAVVIGSIVILSNRFYGLPVLFIYSAMLLTTYILSFYGLRQRMIYRTVYPDHEEVPAERYSRSSLTKKHKEAIKSKLLEHFSNEKPYMNPDLSMQMLSDAIKVPKHQITEVLNTDIGRNFFQFVNEYRVEAVKRLLEQKNHPWSIEAIGYECGFNSKSTFFSVFKTFTGKTPFQYRTEI